MAALLNQGFTEMDVPIDRPTLVASRVPLIAAAHAATLDRAPRPAVVERVAVDEHAARARPGAVAATWAVQVGVYLKERLARQAAFVAHRLADDGEPLVERTSVRGRMAWRAQLVGLTGPEAQGACTRLAHHRTPCVVLRPEAREVASR